MNSDRFAFDGNSLITPELMSEAMPTSRARAQDEGFATARVHQELVLNIARQGFEREGNPAVVLDELIRSMHELRSGLAAGAWQDLLPFAQAHPVAALIHRDPFTHWSFRKPRGYSGDAGLLDFIYGHPSVEAAVATASPIGRRLYEYTSAAPAAAAVRERRDLLARRVDEIAEARDDGAEILTIAAGHLREADRSAAFRQDRLRRWIALDQDPLSVGSIARDFRGTCVEAIDGSVADLLKEKVNLGRFDFIYAAGLYDYLPRSVAIKLTRSCIGALKPNGTFLFANFARGIIDDAYMETFMNWMLILRSEDEVWDIVNSSVDRNVIDARVEFGTNGNIIYATMTRR